MDKVNLSLHADQLRKLAQGKVAQLTHGQLVDGGGAINVDADMPLEQIHTLAKNIRSGRGFRLHPKHILGGSILHHIKHFGKELLKKQSTKDLITAGLQAGAVAASTAATGNPTLGMAAAPAIHAIVNHDYRGHTPASLAAKVQDHAMGQINQHIDAGTAHAQSYINQQIAPYQSMYRQAQAYQPYGGYAGGGYGGYGGYGGGYNWGADGYVDPYMQQLMYGVGIGPEKLKKVRAIRSEKKISHREALAHIREEERAEKEASRTPRGHKIAEGHRRRKEKMMREKVIEHMMKINDAPREEIEEYLDKNPDYITESFLNEKPTKTRGKKRLKGGSIKSTFQNLGNQIKSAFTNKANQNAAIAGGVGMAIDAATGTPIGTLATPLIDQGVTALRNKIGMGIVPHHRHHSYMGMGIGLTPHRLGQRIRNPDGHIVGGIPTPLMSENTLHRITNTINTRKLTGGSFASPSGP